MKMKSVLCLAVSCTLFACVVGEMCRNDTTCATSGHVQCPEKDYEIHCVHVPRDNPVGQCTCTQAMSTCASKNDCHQPNCDDHREHCVDNKCRCGLFDIHPPGHHGPGNHN